MTHLSGVWRDRGPGDEAEEDWGQSFDDMDSEYWEDHYGGPEDDYWDGGDGA